MQPAKLIVRIDSSKVTPTIDSIFVRFRMPQTSKEVNIANAANVEGLNEIVANRSLITQLDQRLSRLFAAIRSAPSLPVQQLIKGIGKADAADDPPTVP